MLLHSQAKGIHRRRTAHHVVLMCLLVLFSACERQTETQVLRRGNGADPATLQPHLAEDTPSLNILRDLYEGLVREAPGGSIEPGIASYWEVSDDATRYRFTLRESFWSDGTPLLAEHFVAGFRHTIDPETGSSMAALLDPIVNASGARRGEAPLSSIGVVALDEYTLEIRLRHPTAYFLHVLVLPQTMPLYPRALPEEGPSNGAYELVETIPGAQVCLQRNEQYWDAANVSIEAVCYYVTEDPAAEFLRYRAGDIDFTQQIPTNQYESIRKNFEEDLQVAPFFGTYYYALNLQKGPLTDHAGLREALMIAVDREVLVQKVRDVGEEAAYTLVPPGIAGYHRPLPPWALLPREAQLARAQQLYRDAGFSPADPLRLTLIYNSGGDHKKIAVAIAQMWKQALGVHIELVQQEFRVLLETRKHPDRWEVIRLSWVGDYMDPNSFLELFTSGHAQNTPGFSDPLYDELIAAALVEMNPSARLELLSQAEERLLNATAIVPLYYFAQRHLIRKTLTGFVPNALNRYPTRLLRWDRPARRNGASAPLLTTSVN